MIYPTTVSIDTPGVGTWAVEDVTLVGAHITHGSDDLWDLPDPSTASFTLLDPQGVWRTRLGFTTRVTFTTVGTIRFTGTVTDLKVSWDGAWVLDVIAVAPKVATRTTLVGPRPQETAADRIQACWTAAGLTIHGVDTNGSVALLPTEDTASASELVDAAASADLGLLSPRRDGALWYRGRATIAASPLVRAVLPAAGIYPSTEWVRLIGDLSTRVRCGYGTNQPQDVAEAVDAALETTLGRTQTTAYADNYATQADAALIAAEVLGRRTDPAWRTSRLDVDLALDAYDVTRTGNVLDLEVGDLVWVQGAPAATPAGTEEVYVVLGWDESLDGTHHGLSLRVVEYAVVRDRAMWGTVAMSWAAAGSTPVGQYAYGPPALDAGVAA